MSNEGAILNALQAEEKAVPVGVKASAQPIRLRLLVKTSIPFPPVSRPGSPAHLRTGRYARSWRAEARGKSLTISNRAFYAAFLEAGTRKMAARPALTGKAGNITGAIQSATRGGVNAGKRVRGGKK